MTQSKERKSFRETVSEVAAEFEAEKSNRHELEFYAWRRVQCFDSAYHIVFEEEDANMARQLATLFKADEFKEDKHFGAVWPKGLEFVTFSCYYVDAPSALSVLSSFASTVLSCYRMAEVEMLVAKQRKTRLDRTDISDEDTIDLWRGTRAKARWQLEADKWVNGEAYRDRRILKHRVERELWQILHGMEQSIVSLEGPIEPDSWRKPNGDLADGRMGPSAFALVKYLWNQKSRSAELIQIQEALGEEWELKQIQQYMKEANNLFRADVQWSLTSRGKPVAKIVMLNKPPKPSRKKKALKKPSPKTTTRKKKK